MKIININTHKHSLFMFVVIPKDGKFFFDGYTFGIESVLHNYQNKLIKL